MNVNGSLEEGQWQSGLYDCCSGWSSTLLCKSHTGGTGLLLFPLLPRTGTCTAVRLFLEP